MAPAAVFLPVVWLIVPAGDAIAPWRRWARSLGAYVGGGLAVAAALPLWLAARGALDEFIYTQFVWNVAYAQTESPWMQGGLAETFDLFGKSWALYLSDLTELALALPLGALGLWWWRRRGRTVPWRAVAVWGVALGFGLFSMIVQFKFFNYHFWPVLPFLAVSIAVGLWGAVEWWAERWRSALAATTPRRRWAGQALCVGLAALAGVACLNTKTGPRVLRRRQDRALRLIRGAEDHRDFVERFNFAHFYRPIEDEWIARICRDAAPDGAPPRLYVWAFRPACYFLSGTTGPSRFPYNLPLRADWSPPEWSKEVENEVMKPQPPDFVAVGVGDFFHWVVGNKQTSWESMPPWLRQYVWRDCERVARFRFIELWARKSLHLSPDAVAKSINAKGERRHG